MNISSIYAQSEHEIFDLQCKVDSDCQNLWNCESGQCVHKGIFPLTLQETLCTILVCLLNAIGTSGGIAESGLLTPYMMLIMNQSLTQSVNIAYILGVGGALGNYFTIAFKRDKDTQKPLINYDINMMLVPMILAGSLLGVTIHRELPNIVTDALLYVVLVFSIVKFYKKYKSQLRAEHDTEHNIFLQEQSKLRFQDSSNQLIQPLNWEIEYHKESEVTQEEKRLFPARKLCEIIVTFLIMALFGYLRGSIAMPSILGIEFCGFDYWMMMVVSCVFMFIWYWRAIWMVRSWQRAKHVVGFPFGEGELVFTRKRCFALGALGFFAGLFGATVAIGGGLIIQPFLLSWHMPPKFTSYTTAFFVIFTMLNATYQQVLFGQISLMALLWYGGLSFTFSFVSGKIVTAYIEKTGRQSVVLQLLLFVIILSFVTQSYVLATSDWNSLFAPGSFCSNVINQ